MRNFASYCSRGTKFYIRGMNGNNILQLRNCQRLGGLVTATLFDNLHKTTHVARLPTQRWAQRAFHWQPRGCKKFGRPHVTWEGKFEIFCRFRNLGVWKRRALDSIWWRSLTDDLAEHCLQGFIHVAQCSSRFLVHAACAPNRPHGPPRTCRCKVNVAVCSTMFWDFVVHCCTL